VWNGVIADSPYRADEPALTPGGGALAGIVGSLLMLLALVLLQPVSGLSMTDLLVRIARVILPNGTSARFGSMLIAGGAIYALLGALLGVLYAVSQDRAPARALVAVGVFYGFVIWVVGRVVTAWLFGAVFRAAFHSYAWFLACLLYGTVLAAYAVWVEHHRPPASAHAVPVD
jgi:hypothetical protein